MGGYPDRFRVWITRATCEDESVPTSDNVEAIKKRKLVIADVPSVTRWTLRSSEPSHYQASTTIEIGEKIRR